MLRAGDSLRLTMGDSLPLGMDRSLSLLSFVSIMRGCMSSLSLVPLPEEDDIVRLGVVMRLFGEDRLRFVGVELFIEKERRSRRSVGLDLDIRRQSWSWCRLSFVRPLPR